MITALLVFFSSYSHASVFTDISLDDPIAILNHTDEGKFLLSLLMVAEQKSDWVSAQLASLQKEGLFNKDKTFKAVELRILHDIDVSQGNLTSAQTHANQMLHLGKASATLWIQAEAMTLKGMIAARRGVADEAFEMINESIELATESNHERILSRALNTRGALHSRKLNYEASIADYQRAISLIKDATNRAFVSKVYSNISVVYSLIKDWDEAIKYNQKAINIYLKGHFISDEHVLILYSNASDLFAEAGDIKAAFEYSEKSTEIASQSPNKQLLQYALWTQSELLLNTGKFQQAKAVVTECLAITEGVYDPIARNQCLLGLGIIRFNLGEMTQARDDGLAALEAFEQLQVTNLQLESHQLLADVYQALNDLPAAIWHLKRFYEGTQAVLFDNREAQTVEMQAKFEHKLQQEQIALLESKNALSAVTLEKNALSQRLLIMFILLVSLTFLFLLKRYNGYKQRVVNLSQSNKHLYEQSNRDQLTEIFNRRYMEHFVSMRASHAQTAHFSVIIIDCDHFKQVNDTYGHEVGDEVLRECARRFSMSIREGDILSRWGGEEFLLLLGCKTEELPQQALTRLNQVIAQKPITTSKGNISITVSIGASPTVPNSAIAKDWHCLKVAADSALYLAKEEGRNCARVALELC
ncbi:diguanylate cyclase [Shewanella maritima]|uniref:tetratricopeptide repeat-containing diguanylate cyclase n=1 Tax=Shewanella maritima TaxID=2520507 RepID=UPI00373687A0